MTAPHHRETPSRQDGSASLADRRGFGIGWRVAPAAALVLGVLAAAIPARASDRLSTRNAPAMTDALMAQNDLSEPAPTPAPTQASPAPSAADLTGVLPAGATSVQESYQDWAVVCQRQAAAEKCAMTETQIDPQSKQRIVTLELTASADGNGVSGVLYLPFGIDFRDGARLKVGDAPLGDTLAFRTCMPVACLVPVSFDANAIAALRKADVLGIDVIASQTGKPITLVLSLKGFGPAADRTIRLDN
ncbi:invasion associated locus B family protein [Segnochrobactrum spirostomi]|nr:invasion associated locus B family protein [Segnochrobactrum spirostomi]